MAQAQITLTAGQSQMVIPSTDQRRKRKWMVAPADAGGGRVRYSDTKPADPADWPTSGLIADPGQGESIVGERIDCGPALYVYAVADTVICVEY